jgi:hypothetical protein
MNELEQDLRAMRLAAPSAELDRRLMDAFAAAGRTRRPALKATPWWWLAAVTTAGAVAALLLAWPSSAASSPVVYRIEAQGRMRALLLEPPAGRERPPRFVLRAGAP